MSGRGPKYKPPNQGIIKRKGKTLGPGGKGLPKGWNTKMLKAEDAGIYGPIAQREHRQEGKSHGTE